MHTNKTAMPSDVLHERIRHSVAQGQPWLFALLHLAGGLLAASAVAFGTLAPFGVAFAAAVKRKYTLPAALGAVAGYLLISRPAGTLGYILSLCLLFGAQWMLGASWHKNFVRVAAAGFALALPALTLVFVTGGTVYDGMLAFSETLLGCCAVYFLARSLEAVDLGLENIKQIDITSIIITFCIITLGLVGFSIFGLSVGRILAVAVILLTAHLFREGGGAIAGISGGMAAGLFGGQAFLMGTYGFGGLLAGIFAPLGRLASAGVFIILHLFALLASRRGDIQLLLIELLLGAAISMLPPEEWLHRVRICGQEKNEVKNDTYRTMLGGQLGQMSGALRRVATTTRQVNDRLAALYQDDPSSICETVAARVCGGCSHNSVCWQQRYNDTSNLLGDFLGELRRGESVKPASFPGWFIQQCPCSVDLENGIRRAFESYTSRESLRRRTSCVRGVVTDQFESMALMIDSMGEEINGLQTQDTRAQGRVSEYLNRQKVYPDDVICTVDQQENMCLTVTMPVHKLSRVDETELTLAVSELCEREFDLPARRDANEGQVSLTFREKAVFSIRWNAAQISSSGSRLCGDSYSYVDARSGRVNVILSDGMGSGGAAAVDSTMTAQLLKNLIEAGVSPEAGLKLVNSALLVRTGEESLATIDITGIDLYTGKTEFYKAGAAPTFLRKSGKSGYVESRSMPAGILNGIEFEKNVVMLRDGDWVVMVSDGVVFSGYDWILSELEHYAGDDPDDLCERLANEARRRRSDGHEDDITVIAIRLEKGI